MLEFQEDFFQQEIRNGFYLDVTMKTVWAAELELLQKVAEVCDKYGLAWYAAYGTLLGAIRHEGFVPWDDDMDIWMKRSDYNKLMEVLQQELPKGYVVHSALSERGNDQFHTCVNNGTGINVSKEWLEQFHGCPFTVGLDIFPLDYLPREESKRKLQENLFLLAASAAQIARGLDRGEFAAAEGEDASVARARKADVINRMKEEIACLKENCGFDINEQLLKEERWYELSSEMWKWANQVAMMYDEQESDHLVMYLDYYKWKHKKFLKEWFEDGYSASFEGFMLPIPAGYDQTLRLLYGEYDVCRKKTGMHEYPYYARQLREVRKLLKQREEEIKEQTGGTEVSVLPWEDLGLPVQWEKYVLKKDGTRKKIILSANDPTFYLTYGDAALNKLEQTLKQMEDIQEEVALWWRPHPVMKQLLAQQSAQLAERYQGILDNYKMADWGICDETDNTERAVAQCDVYYGEMNAILQSFQNTGKAVIIAHMEGDSYQYSNEEQWFQQRGFCHFTDFVEKDGKVYMANTNYNALMIVDKESGRLLESIPFKGVQPDMENMHYKCVMIQDKICFLPVGASGIHVYDIKTGEQKYFNPQVGEKTLFTWELVCCDAFNYIVPDIAERGLWKWNVESNDFQWEDWWCLPKEGERLVSGQMGGDSFYTLCFNTNRFYVTKLSEKKTEEFILPDDHVLYASYDGKNFWYVMCGCTDVVCWSRENGVVARIPMHRDMYVLGDNLASYSGVCCAEDKVFVISYMGECIYWLDQSCQELKLIHTREPGTWDWNYFFKKVNNKLLIMLRKYNKIISIDLQTLEVIEYSVSLQIGIEEQWRQTEILLHRGTLLYEEQNVGLKQVLHYCDTMN